MTNPMETKTTDQLLDDAASAVMLLLTEQDGHVLSVANEQFRTVAHEYAMRHVPESRKADKLCDIDEYWHHLNQFWIDALKATESRLVPIV